ADWIAGAAIAALWLGYKLLVFPGSTPVLILAFAFEWLQVTIGVFYHAISGRELLTMFSSDYRPMVLIGLASVATFAIGIRAGVQLAWRNRTPGHAWPEQALSWPVLIVAYVVMLSSETAIREFAWDNASITQAVLAVDMARLGVLFLMFRRLTRPSIRWHLVGLLLAVEIVMGLSADWWQRDPAELMKSMDALVDRMWAIYYPALAVARIPSHLAHTNGALLWAVIEHITMPRVLFPDKPELPSNSDLVRHYSGVWVAGQERNTSIAFGYAAESYVDFGMPLMFVPMLVFAVFMGAAYAWMMNRIRHRELAFG